MGKTRPCIVGVGMTQIGKHPGKTSLELAIEAVNLAIKDAEVSPDEIHGFYVTPESFTGPNAKMLAARWAEYFQLNTKSLALMECGGITSAIALKYAIDEIQLGRSELSLILAVDMMLKEMPEDLSLFLSTAVTNQVGLYGPFDAPYGFGAPIPYYAMSTQRYMYEYGVSEENIANVPVILRNNASKNPNAHFRNPITINDVLSSRMVSPPIHFLECSSFSDGSAAILVASEKWAKKRSDKKVAITGVGEAHDASHFIPSHKSITSFEAVTRASEMAYDAAKVRPTDIDVAEVYGVFAATELMIYEDLGFFKKGEAPMAVKHGYTKLDGEIGMNPSGGRLSLGHPATATPLLETIEIVHQIRGESGERQVNDAKRGLVHAEHGMLNGSVVFILES